MLMILAIAFMFFLPCSGVRKPAAVIQNQAVFAWMPSAVPNSTPGGGWKGSATAFRGIVLRGLSACRAINFFCRAGCARGCQKQVVASVSWPRDASERKGGSRSVNTLAGSSDQRAERHHRNVEERRCGRERPAEDGSGRRRLLLASAREGSRFVWPGTFCFECRGSGVARREAKRHCFLVFRITTRNPGRSHPRIARCPSR
jgi:hypothetical protein